MKSIENKIGSGIASGLVAGAIFFSVGFYINHNVTKYVGLGIMNVCFITKIVSSRRKDDGGDNGYGSDGDRDDEYDL